MLIQQNSMNDALRYSDLKTLQIELAKQAHGKQILHHSHHQVATGGSAATVEIEDRANETIADIGKTETELWIACDTDDAAYDTKKVYVRYLDADGVKQYCSGTFNAADTKTPVQCVDVATGLVVVVDFYCLDPDYGVAAVVSEVAAQTGDNIVIGIQAGLVAGIADPTICYAHINAAATSPLAADMYGVGSLWASTAANAADAGFIGTVEFVTPWGAIETGNYTIPADSSVVTRFASLTYPGLYVNAFYRRRKFALSAAAVDEVRLCNAAKTAIYDGISIGNSTSTFSRYWVPNATSTYRAFIGNIRADYTVVSEFCNVTITYTNEDGAADFVKILVTGHHPIDVELLIPIEPNTEVKAVVVDDGATGGTLDFTMNILEVQN